MKQILTSLFLFLFSGAVKKLMPDQQTSLLYAKTVEASRLLLLIFLGMSVCVILFLTGIILMHVCLFLYAPWSGLTKMLVGFLCAAVYVLAAALIAWRLFAQDRWENMFHGAQESKND